MSQAASAMPPSPQHITGNSADFGDDDSISCARRQQYSVPQNNQYHHQQQQSPVAVPYAATVASASVLHAFLSSQAPHPHHTAYSAQQQQQQQESQQRYAQNHRYDNLARGAAHHPLASVVPLNDQDDDENDDDNDEDYNNIYSSAGSIDAAIAATQNRRSPYKVSYPVATLVRAVRTSLLENSFPDLDSDASVPAITDHEVQATNTLGNLNARATPSTISGTAERTTTSLDVTTTQETPATTAGLCFDQDLQNQDEEETTTPRCSNMSSNNFQQQKKILLKRRLRDGLVRSNGTRQINKNAVRRGLHKLNKILVQRRVKRQEQTQQNQKHKHQRPQQQQYNQQQQQQRKKKGGGRGVLKSPPPSSLSNNNYSHRPDIAITPSIPGPTALSAAFEEPNLGNSAAAVSGQVRRETQELSSSATRNDRMIQSVTASYVGTADSIFHAAIDGLTLLDLDSAEVYIEYDDARDYDEYARKMAANNNTATATIPRRTNVASLPITHASNPVAAPDHHHFWKADKTETPDVDFMLHRAVLESRQEEDHIDDDNGDDSEQNEACAILLSLNDEETTTQCQANYLTLPSTMQQPTVTATATEKITTTAIPLTLPFESYAVIPNSSSFVPTVPLSSSSAENETSTIYNDMLKVVFVGSTLEKSWLVRAIRKNKLSSDRRANSKARTRTLAVDVHQWKPSASSSLSSKNVFENNVSVENNLPITMALWDVQGSTSSIDGRPDFGGHPATQSLFFSDHSLYILVWDLGANNPRTCWRKSGSLSHIYAVGSSNADGDDSSDDDDDDEEDEFFKEELMRQADRALDADIESRVLSWVDCIAARSTDAAILPVVVMPHDKGMTEQERERRCEMLKDRLAQHSARNQKNNRVAPKILSGDNIICVNHEGKGLDTLRASLLAITKTSLICNFPYLCSTVPEGTPMVYDVIRQFKQDHKLILLDHLLEKIDPSFPAESVVNILHFLSNIGEILYFGNADDEVLHRYIILSHKWFVSALSCILRNDLENELATERPFMRMQCFYSNEDFPENEVATVLLSGLASSCPLLSSGDARMLWNSKSFMKQAANNPSLNSKCSASAPSVFYFLERLLTRTGIFVPILASKSSIAASDVYFIPSLLPKVDPCDIWNYRICESWSTTLCHSWLFRTGAPSDLMESITTTLLKDLYAFSMELQDSPPQGRTSDRTHNLPISYEEQDEQAMGRVEVYQLQCWQSTVLMKIGTVFVDKETNKPFKSFAEILVSVVDQSSELCVSSQAMRSGRHRVIVSGKGQVGHFGRKLWKGGYKLVLESVRSVIDKFSNVDSQIVCPDCIAQSHPESASTWSWDDVLAMTSSSSPFVRCTRRGHRISAHLLCGTCKDPGTRGDRAANIRSLKHVTELLPSVVVVALWDPSAKRICNVGSGVIVDKKLGLIATAAHTLFNMDKGHGFGQPYFGIRDAKVAIGVILDGGDRAVFRYLGDVCADDVQTVDACIVRIRTRLENDVDNGDGFSYESEVALGNKMTDEDLQSLKLTTRCELDEPIRILGFNQGGEGVAEKGKHINRTCDFARGYICKKFSLLPSEDSSGHQVESGSSCCFQPREEIVAICPTIAGHSGGPCVNEEGKVVGILSRADPVDRARCYLVPSRELKILLKQARERCFRPSGESNSL